MKYSKFAQKGQFSNWAGAHKYWPISTKFYSGHHHGNTYVRTKNFEKIPKTVKIGFLTNFELAPIKKRLD